VNSAIWLAIAYGRLGKPLPEAIIKRATTEMNGGWSRPALAMLAGAMPPDVLLRTLAAKNGDERQMALSERYFYLGQHYLAAGDKKSAQAYFKNGARAKGHHLYGTHRCWLRVATIGSRHYSPVECPCRHREERRGQVMPLYQPGLHQSGLNEGREQWMRFERARFQFGMELHSDEPGVVLVFDDLRQHAVRGDA